MNINSGDLLLVEDNMNDAGLTNRELKKHHFSNNVFRVCDGEEALDFIFAAGKYHESRSSEKPPRLILPYIKMPKINGLEVLKKIKADENTKSIPVVMLTSSKEDPDIKASYKLGANSYIVKPMNFVGFAEAIKNLGFYRLLLNERPF